MTQAELFHKAINYLKDNFKNKIDLSFPDDLTNEKFTLHNLKRTWYPILIECLQSKADIKPSEQQPDFTNWSLNKKIFSYKQGHLDILAPLIKTGLVFNDIDHTNVDSFESVKFDDIAHNVREYANRIGTQSNGIYINNRILLAIIQGTQVHYEHYFGNWDVYQQQQHINYLLDYNTEQFTSEFDVDANDAPHYLYTDVNGLVTANTYTALIIATQIYLAVQNGNTGDPKIITGNISSELISDLNAHDINLYGQNELVKAALVFNGCYVDDLEVNNAVPLFCDRFNISSNLDDINNRKQFYTTLFGVYHPNMASKASISLVSHIQTNYTTNFDKPNPRVIQTFWIDQQNNKLYILQLNNASANKKTTEYSINQYIYLAPLNQQLTSNNFQQIYSFTKKPTNGHTQTLIPLDDHALISASNKIITGSNPDTTKSQWDYDFKAVQNLINDPSILASSTIINNIKLGSQYHRTELALSPNRNILIFGVGIVDPSTIQNSYCIPLDYQKLNNDLINNIGESVNLSDYQLVSYNNKSLASKSVIYQYYKNDSYLNGKSLQGYGIDDDLNVYVSCGKSPNMANNISNIDNWSDNPPFLIFVKSKAFEANTPNTKPSFDEHINNYQRIDLGPDKLSSHDNWYDYLVKNDLLETFLADKAKILRRDNYLLEFENIQVINTNESNHYACYLNIAYHSLVSKSTNLNIIYRLDWYDRFDEEN